MKIYLVLGLVIVGMTATASAQSYSTTTTAKKTQVQQRRPAPISNRDVTGVVPRAIRGGNPLQMLNPRAPAKYGTAEDSVRYEPGYSRKTSINDANYPGKWKGIKLFTFLF